VVASGTRKPVELGIVRDVEAGERPEPRGIDAAFRRHAPLVAGIVYRLIGRREEVEDVVQDVFLAAMHGLARLQHPEAVRSWLTTVAVRKTMRHLRRRRWRTWLLRDDYEYDDIASRDASPEVRSTLASVYRALDRVPARDRSIFLLRHVQGEELQRIAKLAGCSLATVKRRIEAVERFLNREEPHG